MSGNRNGTDDQPECEHGRAGPARLHDPEQVDGAPRHDQRGLGTIDYEQPYGLVGIHVLVITAVASNPAAVQVVHDVGEAGVSHGCGFPML